MTKQRGATADKMTRKNTRGNQMHDLAGKNARRENARRNSETGKKALG